MIPFRFALPLALAVALCAPVQAASLPSLAGDIAALDDELGALWPGYWPAGQPFVLYRDGQCVMRSNRAPESGFRAIDGAPGLWTGRCDDARFQGPMVLDETIAGIDAPAVEIDAQRADLRDGATYLLHEAFHAFQHDHFGTIPRQHTDFAFPLDEDLVRMKLRESSFLLSAADTDDRTRQIALVRAAIATRKARLARMPAEAESIEDQYLRIEGTAEYVSMRADAAIRGSDAPARYLQDRLKTISSRMGRTWEFMLRWQGYTTGAAAYLVLDRWEVDWKAHVADGMAVYDVLETASGYDDAEGPALLEASAQADSSGVFATARQLVRNDRASDKALAQYREGSTFTLTLLAAKGNNASFEAGEMHTVPGGTLVPKPSAFTSAGAGSYEMQVRARPVLLWNSEEEAPLGAQGAAVDPEAGMTRYDVSLSSPPTLEGCAAQATQCGAGTRIRSRGVELTLLADHALLWRDDGLVVRPDASAQSQHVDRED